MTATPEDIKFLNWLHENGADTSKIEWPSKGTVDGVRGATALTTIKPNEPMLFIPDKLMITPSKCRASPFLRDVYTAHSEYFDEDDDRVLAFYLMHESVRGEESFWHPYLSILPIPDVISNWGKDDLIELQDRALCGEARRRPVFMHKEYERLWLSIESNFPEFFPRENYSFELYVWAWSVIQSRAFGRRLPWAALVPFADCLNHSNVSTKYDYNVDKSGTFRLFPSGNNCYEKGSEVFNSYGRRSNRFLLLEYGFALPDNEWDSVEVFARLPPMLTCARSASQDPLQRNADVVREQFNGKAHVLRSSFLSSFKSFRLRRNRRCLEILAFFRVVVMDADELSDALAFIQNIRQMEIDAERERDELMIQQNQAEEEQRLIQKLMAVRTQQQPRYNPSSNDQSSSTAASSLDPCLNKNTYNATAASPKISTQNRSVTKTEVAVMNPNFNPNSNPNPSLNHIPNTNPKLDQWPWESVVSCANELRALEALRLFLSKQLTDYHTSIKTDEQLLACVLARACNSVVGHNGSIGTGGDGSSSVVDDTGSISIAVDGDGSIGVAGGTGSFGTGGNGSITATSGNGRNDTECSGSIGDDAVNTNSECQHDTGRYASALRYRMSKKRILQKHMEWVEDIIPLFKFQTSSCHTSHVTYHNRTKDVTLSTSQKCDELEKQQHQQEQQKIAQQQRGGGGKEEVIVVVVEEEEQQQQPSQPEQQQYQEQQRGDKEPTQPQQQKPKRQHQGEGRGEDGEEVQDKLEQQMKILLHSSTDKERKNMSLATSCSVSEVHNGLHNTVPVSLTISPLHAHGQSASPPSPPTSTK